MSVISEWLTHWPMWDASVITLIIFILISRINVLHISCEVFLRHRTNDWLVNVGSGNGFVPSDSRLLPEPMLTKFYDAVTRPHWVYILALMTQQWPSPSLAVPQARGLNCTSVDQGVMWRHNQLINWISSEIECSSFILLSASTSWRILSWRCLFVLSRLSVHSSVGLSVHTIQRLVLPLYRLQ